MIRNAIKGKVAAAVKEKFGIVAPEFSVAVSENPEHGDYATNVALLLAKAIHKNPMEIAEAITGAFNVRRSAFRATVAPPGFLNFSVSRSALKKGLQEILQKKERYGAGKKQKEKIQVEFISANPTGPLTLANGRGGFFGDVLARVLAFEGFLVEREYYINDAGNQIFTLGNSLLAAERLIAQKEEYYRGDYVASWAKKNKVLLLRLKEKPEELGRKAAAEFLRMLIRPATEKKMKIQFDRWTSEYRDVRKKGCIEKARAIFKKQGLEYEKDGAVWLKTTVFGDDKDRVLVTSDGYPTYFLVDAGHYWETRRRGLGKINIVGADHHGYVSRIQAVAKILGFSRSEVVVMQLVRLMSGGKEVRMSKRRGTFVTIDELINEVGTDVARYFFLEKSPDTHMDFDLDLAKEQSVKNPVYYIQYAHARMVSIFRKAESVKRVARGSNLKLLNSPEELDLIKKLIQFPEVVEDTAHDYHVHRITRYAYDLARGFHDFYEKHRVVSEDRNTTAARLAIVRATHIVLQSVLGLLGISAPQNM